jgi:hypothetical protein
MKRNKWAAVRVKMFANSPEDAALFVVPRDGAAEDARDGGQDLRAFGETEHWECRKCGYEYRR